VWTVPYDFTASGGIFRNMSAAQQDFLAGVVGATLIAAALTSAYRAFRPRVLLHYDGLIVVVTSGRSRKSIRIGDINHVAVVAARRRLLRTQHWNDGERGWELELNLVDGTSSRIQRTSPLHLGEFAALLGFGMSPS
jgi:hypothetical protein